MDGNEACCTLTSLLRSVDYKRLKPYLLNRMLLVTYVGVVLVISFSLMWSDGKVQFNQGSVIVLAILMGIVLSNYTEGLFAGLAERCMNLLGGFGNKNKDAECDENGVPIVSLRGLGKKFYNPVTVAMIGFQHFDKWMAGDDAAMRLLFLNCADSLIETMKVVEARNAEYGIWEYEYEWTYNLVPPWRSGLAQGVCVQLLTRAYSHTNEKKYIEAARVAMNAFYVEVCDGGVTYKDARDEWWYEEYVGNGCEVSRVLNGMVYALIGIHEYWKAAGDDGAEQLFAKGVNSLKGCIWEYDTGWWTYYDAIGLVATKSYHKVHIDLMQQLYEITDEELFKEAHDKWSNYRGKFFVREFVRQEPSWHDLMILMLNVGVSFALLEVVWAIHRITS